MNTFAEDENVTVTPLRAFPVIKDLVADVSFNYQESARDSSIQGTRELKARRVPHGTNRCAAQSRIPQVH